MEALHSPGDTEVCGKPELTLEPSSIKENKCMGQIWHLPAIFRFWFRICAIQEAFIFLTATSYPYGTYPDTLLFPLYPKFLTGQRKGGLHWHSDLDPTFGSPPPHTFLPKTRQQICHPGNKVASLNDLKSSHLVLGVFFFLTEGYRQMPPSDFYSASSSHKSLLLS